MAGFAQLAWLRFRGAAQGVASLILQHLIRIGRNNGILVFVADVLAQNQAMLSVFRRVELPMKKRLEGDVVHIELSLTLD
jgi:hypothetical protein